MGGKYDESSGNGGGGEVLKLIRLAQNRAHWRDTVNAVLIYRVSYMLGIS
jgi:hypothetical protein